MKTSLYLALTLAVLVTGNCLATIIGPLDGVSGASTFDTMPYDPSVHSQAPAGWTSVSGYPAIDVFRDNPEKNAALCYNWPNTRFQTYIAQFTTSVAAQADTLYTVSLLAGSHVNWDNGAGDYFVSFGTVTDGAFTAFSVSDVERVNFTGAAYYLGDNLGEQLSFTGTSGTIAPAGLLAIQIQVTSIDFYWPAIDTVVLDASPIPEPTTLLFAVCSLVFFRRK
jgi:hypothetical protein